MGTTNIREVQEENQSDPVESILAAARGIAGELGESGLKFPEVITFGPHGPVTIVDDRDRVVGRPRTRRFGIHDLSRALGAAASVSIVPYEKRSGRRIGKREANWQALTLGTRIAEGGAVVVLTTSDRVRHWLDEIRCRGGSDVVVELFDRSGVAKIVEGGV